MPSLRRKHPVFHSSGIAFVAVSLAVIASGCVSDVELDEEDQDIDVGAVTRSIFDPTNPVEVLQLIPAPTALAQVDPTDANEDGLFGDVDFAATAPDPCEGLTTASCLPLVAQGGWPTEGVNPELFFSSRIVESTAAEGIVLLEEQDNGSFAPLSFTIAQSTLEAPPNACLTDVPNADVDAYTETVRVEIIPDAGFQPSRRYLVFATKALQGVPATDDSGNTSDPRPVEPSGLFYLLAINGADTPPPPITVDENGRFTITGPLQAQVESSVLAALGPDAPPEAIDAAIQQSAEGLFGLQAFFRGLADAAEAALQIDRADLVFANTWSTGAAGRDDFPKVVFAPDPEGVNQQLPFPNVPLLTTATVTADGPDVINDIPRPPGSGGLVRAIFDGLNTLNGFGVTTPIALSTTAPIDPQSADGSVLLVPYDPSTSPPTVLGPPVDVQVTGSPVPTGQDVTGRDVYALRVQPVEPLLPDTFYALGITSALVTSETRDQPNFIADDTFVPLTQTSTNVIAQIVTCGGIDEETGEFPSAGEIRAQLELIEEDLARVRWQPAFEVFENLPTPIARTNLAVAVPYKTQDILSTVDAVDNQLLPLVYPNLPDPTERAEIEVLPLPSLTTPGEFVTEYLGDDARLFVCNALCSEGLFELPFPPAPAIPRDQCLANPPGLLGHPICSLVSANVDEVRLFDVRNYTLTDGNPQTEGTFTPETVMTPAVTRVPVWYVAGGQAPETGRPITVFQHGLTRQKEDVLPLANTFTSQGWGLFSMDLPFHGARASDIQNNETGAFCDDDPLRVICSPYVTEVECDRGCDDIRDDSGTGYVGLNVFATRDNVRQSAIDHLVLFDHIRSGRFDAFIQGEVDPNRLSFLGLSAGGIAGGVTAAYAEDLESVVLSAAGGSWTTLLLDSVPSLTATLLQALVDLGICVPVDPEDLSQGCQPTPFFNQFVLLAQTALDPGDPLGAASGVVDGRIAERAALGTAPILHQVVLNDGVVPNASSFFLSTAYGFFDPSTQMPSSQQLQIFSAVAGTPGDALAPGCHGLLISPLALEERLDGTSVTALCGAGEAAPLDAICNTLGMQIQAATWIDSAGQTIAEQRATDVLGVPCPE